MANKDIFGRRIDIGENIITSDVVKGVLSAGGTAWVGLLIQTFQATYQQQNSPIYELGSNKTYRLLGRPEGVMTIGRILGVNSALPIDEALFDVCQAGGSMTITARSGTCNGEDVGNFTLTFGGLRASSYSVGADAGRLLVTENVQLSFNYLSRAV